MMVLVLSPFGCLKASLVSRNNILYISYQDIAAQVSDNSRHSSTYR